MCYLFSNIKIVSVNINVTKEITYCYHYYKKYVRIVG